MISTRYVVKIPKYVTMYYKPKNQLLLIKGPINKKLILLKLKVSIDTNRNLIQISDTPFKKLSNFERKNINCIKGVLLSDIKRSFVEVYKKSYKKLKIVGVGFRSSQVTNCNNYNLMHFKLGYSHNLYFKIPKDIELIEHNSTKLIISGKSSQKVSQIASLIRKYKTPEPYKGKGILYDSEKITLKEGKKI